MLDVARDTAAFMQDLAVPVVKAGQNGEADQVTKGVMTQPTRDLNFSGVAVVSNESTLTYATKELTAIEGDVLIADGARYKVRRIGSIANGALSQAELTKL